MGLYYSIGALVVFYVLLIGEFFIPSAGMVGVSAVVAGITAIALGFAHSATTGCQLFSGVRWQWRLAIGIGDSADMDLAWWIGDHQ